MGRLECESTFKGEGMNRSKAWMMVGLVTFGLGGAGAALAAAGGNGNGNGIGRVSSPAGTLVYDGDGYTLSYDSSLLAFAGRTGNTLTFNVSGPLATGISSGTLPGALSFALAADAGWQLSSLNLIGSGSYERQDGNGKGGTPSSVGATGSWTLGATQTDSISFSGIEGANNKPMSWNDTASFANLATGSAKLSLDLALSAFAGTGGNAKAAINFDTIKVTVGTQQVAAVPEPQAYLMLLAGLGMIGVVSRRRAGRN